MVKRLGMLGLALLAGTAIGHAQAEWVHLQEGKSSLYHARDQLKVARTESYYNRLPLEHRRHLDYTIDRVDEAIRAIDLIEGHPGRGPMPGQEHHGDGGDLHS